MNPRPEPLNATPPTPHAPRPTHQACEAACRVTYRMTDQMGVVYYGNYLEFFEIGRTELLRTTGLNYRGMEGDGFFLPVIRVECNYHAPARYDDLLIIRTAVSRLSRIRVDFTYEILRKPLEPPVEIAGEDARAPSEFIPHSAFRIPHSGLLCTGATHHAITDATGRPRRLSPQWLERLEAATAHP